MAGPWLRYVFFFFFLLHNNNNNNNNLADFLFLFVFPLSQRYAPLAGAVVLTALGLKKDADAPAFLKHRYTPRLIALATVTVAVPGVCYLAYRVGDSVVEKIGRDRRDAAEQARVRDVSDALRRERAALRAAEMAQFEERVGHRLQHRETADEAAVATSAGKPAATSVRA